MLGMVGENNLLAYVKESNVDTSQWYYLKLWGSELPK